MSSGVDGKSLQEEGEEEEAAEEERDAIEFQRSSPRVVTSESVAPPLTSLAGRRKRKRMRSGFGALAQRRDVRERLVVDFLSLSFLSHCLPAWTEDPAGYPEAGAKRIALDGVGDDSPLALMSERHTNTSKDGSFDSLLEP